MVGKVQVPKSPKGEASVGWWQVGGRRAKRTLRGFPCCVKLCQTFTTMDKEWRLGNFDSLERESVSEKRARMLPPVIR